eukprot:CAMPEP_0198685728 /NCGR_PEP_ID=MMETSP1468-20131203/14043_1 /TAXON_ID=1461545 /ORGANISM="Mantoniella sp, Strain CCMP1436" /LENGTH=83 /DNA_ID=CAMNT_0044431397 /DNA_START=6 /DNA_END=254 /DNA_ORIENTATION=+
MTRSLSGLVLGARGLSGRAVHVHPIWVFDGHCVVMGMVVGALRRWNDGSVRPIPAPIGCCQCRIVLQSVAAAVTATASLYRLA